MTAERFFTYLLFFYALASPQGLLAQEIRQADWQQRVEYRIQVKLDPEARLLHGQLSMFYHNNAPQELNEIYMHLWPNAYRSTQTPLGKQLIENGKTDFEYASGTQRGYLDSTLWSANGNELQVVNIDSFGEVLMLKLNKPLLSGQSINIRTPFRVYVPDVFSRLGTGMGTWQITQWFPKPAVYDVNGWNPMPYLDQGEFYCSFGSFDVEITVPKNMLVAATGRLLTESEWKLREERIGQPVDPGTLIPPSSELKTLRFVQDSIHDFAWFAATNYNIARGSYVNPNGETVETWVFGVDKPEKLEFNESISQALRFYGMHAGEYPYSHCTVVKGELEAGGGMEYPMITICDVLNKEVVVHEVGHNWFQGMLASNERRYPWMDESVNSFMENLCLKEGASGGSDINSMAMSYLWRESDAQGMGQAIGLRSEDFTWTNYGTYVYGKGAEIFNYLKESLGDSVFWNCMRAYFDAWAFKHPLPGDMQALFERESGKNLNWFFEHWIAKNQFPDFKFKELVVNKTPEGLYTYTINIKSKNGNAAPIKLSFYDGNELIDEEWIRFADHHFILEIDLPDNKVDRVSVMAGYEQFDLNPQNNVRKVNGLFPGLEPLKLKIGMYRDKAEYTEIAWLPIYAWNAHNRSMAGLLLHNRGIPAKKFHYFLLPLYSFHTANLNGYGKLLYQVPLKRGLFQKADFQLAVRRFGFEEFLRPQQYTVIQPGIRLDHRKKRFRSSLQHETHLKAFFLDFASQNNANDQLVTLRESALITRLEHHISQKRIKDPFQINLSAEYGSESTDDFLKFTGRMDYTLSYKKKNKGLNIGLFAGAFAAESTNALYHFRASENNGTYDYLFEYAMMGRSAQSGLWSRQVLPTEDRAKFVGALGNASSWMWALNVETTLPGKLPFKLYADFVGNNVIQDFHELPLVFQAGINFSLFDAILEVYLPLVQSVKISDIQSLNGINRFGDQITFRFDLHRLHPEELKKSIKLF